MKNQCLCISKTAELCCPKDEEFRKEWVSNLREEHDSLRQTSREIIRKSKLLSNSHRVEILLMLEQREHCMDEIAKKLNVQKSALSYHLGLLKKHGLICVKKRSYFAFYSLSQDGKSMIMPFRDI